MDCERIPSSIHLMPAMPDPLNTSQDDDAQQQADDNFLAKRPTTPSSSSLAIVIPEQTEDDENMVFIRLLHTKILYEILARQGSETVQYLKNVLK
jgi:hypothetical protein